MPTLDYWALVDELRTHEGFSAKPYRDSLGVLTIGYGRNLQDNPLSDAEQRALNCPRDFYKEPLSEEEALMLLHSDIGRALQDCESLPWFEKLNATLQRVIANMVYNLGLSGLLGFHDAMAALEKGDLVTAGNEFRRSLWYKQVGHRSQYLVALWKANV